LRVLVFEELATVVGLPSERGEIGAVTAEVDGKLFGQESGVGLGKFIGIAGEGGAGNRFARGVKAGLLPPPRPPCPPEVRTVLFAGADRLFL